MVTTNDVLTGFRGVLAVARGDENWADAFDLSPNGVFMSFWAFLLAFPFILLTTESIRAFSVDLGMSEPLLTGPVWVYILSKVIVSYVMWAIILFGLVQIGQRIEIGWRISPLIMALNWSVLLAYLVIGVGLGLGTITQQTWMLSTLIIATNFFRLWIDWGIFRRPLGLEPIPTIGMIFVVRAIEILMDAGVTEIVLSLTGAQT